MRRCEKVYTTITGSDLSLTAETALAGPKSNSAEETVFGAAGKGNGSHLYIASERSNFVAPIGDGFGSVAQFHNTIIH